MEEDCKAMGPVEVVHLKREQNEVKEYLSKKGSSQESSRKCGSTDIAYLRRP